MKKKSSAGSIMTLLGCQVNTGQIQENRGDIALPAFWKTLIRSGISKWIELTIN